MYSLVYGMSLIAILLFFVARSVLLMKVNIGSRQITRISVKVKLHDCFFKENCKQVVWPPSAADTVCPACVQEPNFTGLYSWP